MSALHTPGPWVARDVLGQASNIVTNDALYVAQVYGHKNKGGPMTANARLIAAAPDLLAALRGLLVGCEFRSIAGNPPAWQAISMPRRGALDNARVAIAKATGGLS